jgi:hypothetical protein
MLNADVVACESETRDLTNDLRMASFWKKGHAGRRGTRICCCGGSAAGQDPFGFEGRIAANLVKVLTELQVVIDKMQVVVDKNH